MGSPLEFTLNELLNVFDQLGRGDLNMTERVELARRARGYIDQLKGAGNGQVVSEMIEEGEYWLMQADMPDSQRKDLASKGQAQSDGSYPIRNVGDLKKAIQAFGRSKDKGKTKRWIMKRAKALGQLALIPDTWQTGPATSQEALQPFITLSQEGEMAVVIQELPTPANNGTMKIRVPFYVGGSIALAKGIAGKLHFGADKLPGIVLEGNQRIAENKQPITVYARHAHALAMDKLPVGRVVGLEPRGDIGYAIMEIAPTADGRDVQALARNKMLNAVSLRANPGSYSLEKILINGEEAWDVDLTLDGIDFAPDGPAQPTYGVEVLAAEARVEQVEISEKRSVSLTQEVLSLEAVKRDRPDLILAIESPLKEANAKLTQELEAAKAALTQANEALGKAKESLSEIERKAYMQELSSKFPDPVKALSVIQELCKDEKTKEDIASKVMPLLLDALSSKTPEAPKPPEPPKNPFTALFPGSGNGQTLGLEALHEKKEEGEVVTGLAVPA